MKRAVSAVTFRTHLAGAFVAAELTIMITHCPVLDVATALLLGGSLIGGLLPDIDHPKSFISTSTLTTRAISMVTTKLTKHRGVLHTPMILALIIAAMFLTPFVELWDGRVYYIALGLSVGYASHLILDTLNPGGIMWFWPITKKYFHIARIKTSSVLEHAIVKIPLVLVMFGLGYLIVKDLDIKGFVQSLIPELSKIQI